MNTTLEPIGRIFRKLNNFVRREILRDAFLLEAKRWFRNCGDETLRLDYPLDADSVVVDLGGYHGDFAEAIHARYGCRVLVFEPMPAFYEQCKARFKDNPRISCFMYGLSNEAGWFDISESEDASSFLVTENGSGKCKAELRSVVDELNRLCDGKVDLIKINIEGGEFDILPVLVSSGLIKTTRFVQVQFHNFITNADARREAIRADLMQSHREMWNYPFVWESWELLKSSRG